MQLAPLMMASVMMMIVFTRPFLPHLFSAHSGTVLEEVAFCTGEMRPVADMEMGLADVVWRARLWLRYEYIGSARHKRQITVGCKV